MTEICCFYDGKKLNFGLIEKKLTNKLFVTLHTGKQVKIALKNIIIAFPCKQNAQEYITNLQEKIKVIYAEIDLEFLWEVLSPTDEEYSLEDLCQNYFNDQEIANIIALFDKLTQMQPYFIRKQNTYAVNCEKIVAQKKQAIQEKKNKDLFQQELFSLLQTWEEISLQQIPYDAKFEPFFIQLKFFLIYKKDNIASKLLQKYSSKYNFENLVIRLLKLTGQISLDADSFLLQEGIIETIIANIPTTRQQEERMSLTSLFTFSIDDQESKDLDDALSVEKQDDLYKLYIHISDVDNLITKDSAIDKEAYKRISSIYMPHKIFNMLGDEISSNHCSLIANQEQNTLSYIAYFNEEMNFVKDEIVLSTIKVDYNYNYDEIDQQKKDNTLHEDVVLACKLLQKHRQLREENQAIFLAREYIEIKYKNEKFRLLTIKNSSFSRSLVEESMILANFIAAKYLDENNLPAVFRSQLSPKEKITNQTTYDPIALDKVIMHMSKTNIGLTANSHASLGVNYYCQITSPIRRYLDLVHTRQIKAFKKGESLPYSKEDLQVLIEDLQIKSNAIIRVQRQAQTNYFLKYFETIKDNIFQGLVIKHKGNNSLVELQQYYFRTELPQKLTIGEIIELKIKSINHKTQKITFVLK